MLSSFSHALFSLQRAHALPPSLSNMLPRRHRSLICSRGVLELLASLAQPLNLCTYLGVVSPGSSPLSLAVCLSLSGGRDRQALDTATLRENEMQAAVVEARAQVARIQVIVSLDINL